ncbi:JAB domain-containing protein, partial [Enterococcus faecalis]
HLVAIYLDTQNRIIEQRTIFIGSVRRSIAEPREILYYACKNMATSVIIVHNHPSGSPEPSENDLQFTQKMKRACEDIGIICL